MASSSRSRHRHAPGFFSDGTYSNILYGRRKWTNRLRLTQTRALRVLRHRGRAGWCGWRRSSSVS
jgi:hypothetical protein